VDIGVLLVFLAAGFLGSLLPDADADGNPAISRARPLYYALRLLVIKPVVLFFRIFVPTKHDVEDLHRGIMHSPIGIFFSTAFIVTLLGAIMYWTNTLGWWRLSIVFAGVYIGQLLHMLEDSCTPGGINWAFPFGDAKLNGSIYTHDLQKNAKLKDVRPFFFYMILSSISLLVIFAYINISSIVDVSLWIVYPVIALLLLFAWLFTIYVAKSDSSLWRLG
jgi:membrane-bound metal-dependent hydrolase YbcI (DUF457 family)